MGYVIGIIITALIIFLLFKLLKASIKIGFKLLLNAVGGFIVLFLLNLFGGLVGLHIDVTWLNAIIVGLIGLPGVIVILLLQYLW